MKLNPKISFEAFCRDVLLEPISSAWVAAYKAFEGKPLNDAELKVFQELSGKADYTPSATRNELWCVKGRRSAGTKTAAKFVTYLISVHGAEYRQFAAKRDRLHALVVLQSREIARETMNYFASFYNDTVLSSEVVEVLKNSIELKSGFVISVATCSYRAPRGLSVPICLLDETGAWRTEGVDLDVAVYQSIRPAMIQFKNSKLIGLGSPWTQSGLLWNCWQHRFERTDRLVLHTPTEKMNPLISREELAREEATDPVNFAREFMAQFTSDIDSFIPSGDVDAAVQNGIREMAPIETRAYFAALDASGLQGRDRFTLAVCHRSGGSAGMGITYDLLRSWSRAGVGEVVAEIATILKSYKIKQVTGDQFGAQFLRELLAQRGIDMKILPFTARSKPEIMLDFKLALSQGRVRLLDHPESLRELRSLESKRTSGGHFTISAPRNLHDDLAIVLALLNHSCKGSENRGWGLLASPGRRTVEF